MGGVMNFTHYFVRNKTGKCGRGQKSHLNFSFIVNKVIINVTIQLFTVRPYNSADNMQPDKNFDQKFSDCYQCSKRN